MDFMGRTYNGSAMPSEIPTGQFARSFLMIRLGRAILGISLIS
jgi:hypothetical protein